MEKNIILVVIFIVFVFIGWWFLRPPKNDAVKKNEGPLPVENIQQEGSPSVSRSDAPVTEPTELVVEDVSIGSGEAVSEGNEVTVHYTGTLLNGTKFDSSLDRGQPFQFTVGTGQVISGWDQGLIGMMVGGKRRLIIPASLAYGDRSPSPLIPANSALVFEIDLLALD